ncbi:MAG: hypothetical protein MI865_03645 [Proteobacteria bacterium]|nr:hypothetical protein [Pseudomonadota bacterium]
MKLNKINEWEYKVVTTDYLMKEPQNHDIAVSQEANNERKDISKNSIQNSLNTLGHEGWELITVLGEFCIFKKSKNGF